jgi:steroid 5-alpha reductase family enzyme
MGEHHENRLVEELRKMEYEPLLAIEKKLILWSIGLGMALIVLLVWVSGVVSPA